MRTGTKYSTDAHRGRTKHPITRHFPLAARLLMGLIFVVMGLNGFLNFLPQPSTPFPERAVAFLGALYATGYMIPLVSGTQVIVGALLLSNRFVPLALTIIAPVIVNIVAVHAFLAPTAAGLALVVLVLELYLAWAYRDSYRPMLVMRATSTSRQHQPSLAPTIAATRRRGAQDFALQVDDWFDSHSEPGVAHGARF